MNIYDILNHLTFNELSQYAAGGFKYGMMQDSGVEQILPIINAGILDINERLDLLQESVTIHTQEDVVTYVLDKKNSLTSSTTGYTYVHDSVTQPFPTRFKAITYITDRNGNRLAVNVRNDPRSIAHFAHNKIQIPEPFNDDYIAIEYTYDPEPIKVVNLAEAMDVEYPLPYFTATALYAYVEESMTAGIAAAQDMQDDTKAESKYEKAIMILQQKSVITEETYYESRFHNSGLI